jgi:glutathione S-transferase
MGLSVLNAILSWLARGAFRQVPPGAQRPEKLLELYSFEGCPACRRVRRRLTELDLDFIHRSCPKGDSPKRRELVERGSKEQVPYLIDPNTGVEMYESRDIVRYLDKTYG